MNSGKNYDPRIGTKSFKNLANFVGMGVTLTSQNCMPGDIKRRIC
jgi:hypothetical protein